ncbi:MAG TPA: serine hydrolase domain-containing protein [Gemmatimonadales bacterium]|nr:serine hydrolase domain-containing protein [Gemmatimonadales bacterium]
MKQPLGLLLLVPFLPIQAQTPTTAARPRTVEQAIAEARRFIQDTMKVLGAPGASITVMRNARVIWSEGFGYADVEQQVKVTPATRFRIGSVSKPLTSIALGLLYEEGKLDLDSPVQRYVPGFPVKRWPITVRQVAGHLAGIRHYNDGEFENMLHYPTVDSGLSIFRNDSLLFEPGTRYAYSSYGWNLLSAVIEGASGQPFLTFMQTRVFGPAGMTHTVPEFNDSIIPFRARFYTRSDSVGPVVNAQYVDNSYKWAGGGFLSTTEDLAHFGQLLLDGKLLQPATRDLWWTSQKTTDGKETGYGIGWGVSTDSTGRVRVGHTGGAMGGTASLQIFPKEKLVIALLVNSDYTFISATPRLAKLFMN